MVKFTFCHLIILFVLVFLSTLITSFVSGSLYSKSLDIPPNFYPTTFVQYEIYVNVTIPENVTVIWWPFNASDYIIYENYVIPPITRDIIQDGCIDLCYSFIAYYDQTTKLIKCGESSAKPLYRSCDQSDSNLYLVCLITGILCLITLMTCPLLIIVYMKCYKKNEYTEI